MKLLERAKGFEPSTPTLARQGSFDFPDDNQQLKPTGDDAKNAGIPASGASACRSRSDLLSELRRASHQFGSGEDDDTRPAGAGADAAVTDDGDHADGAADDHHGDHADGAADDADIASPPIAPRGEMAGLEGGALFYIDVDAIQVGPRLRELDMDGLSQLQESMLQRGLLQPLLIRFEPSSDGPRPVLIAGRRRLAGARQLGWRHILCRAIEGQEIEYQLAEIDDNLMSVGLSAAEQALCLGRRSELYERLYGPAKARGAHAANAAMGKAHATANLAPAFATATAAATGVAERSVQRGVARYAALGPELLKRVSGTSLDLGVELDALAALPSHERDALVGRAAGGEPVSAAEALMAAAQAEQPAQAGEKSEPPQPAGQDAEPSAPEPDEPAQDEPPAAGPHTDPEDDPFADYFVEIDRGLETLKQAWLRAPTEAREYFLAWVASGWRSPEDR